MILQADVKLVERREAVLILIERVATILTNELEGMEAATKVLREISTASDALSLSIEGEVIIHRSCFLVYAHAPERNLAPAGLGGETFD